MESRRLGKSFAGLRIGAVPELAKCAEGSLSKDAHGESEWTGGGRLAAG